MYIYINNNRLNSQSDYKTMNSEYEVKINKIYYLMSFYLFNDNDIEILCSYKQFVESTIIDLGEDWRIQSGLLSQEITSLFNGSMPAQPQSLVNQRLQFNIFNEFLLPFLKDKIGNEKQICNLSQAVIQEHYSEQLNHHFMLNSQVTDSLTFKTLSLGFCIKAVDMWNKSFSFISPNDNEGLELKPLAILEKDYGSNKMKILSEVTPSVGTSTIRKNMSNMDIGSCQHSISQNEEKNKVHQNKNDKKWVVLCSLDNFSIDELNGIAKCVKKTKSSKIQVLTNFAVTILQLQTQGKTVRTLCLNGEFYRNAFIVWLIFNIKLFFSLSFDQFMVYFKKLCKNWHTSFQVPLKKFYMTIEKQWKQLLKDYSVALHDDIQVLKNLILRVKESLLQIWRAKQNEIYKRISD